MKFQRSVVCILLSGTLLLLAADEVGAQSPDKSRDEEKGYSLYEQFEGSSNTLGQVMKLDTTAGYNFNRFFGIDAGVPLYFVRSSQTSTTTGTATNNGIGDAYVGLRLTFDNPAVNFASTLTGRAPTGNTSAGLSTGRATYDWSNHFDRGFGGIRPFVNVGVANSIPDTHFFTRPFTSLGTVGHFEGGTSYRIFHITSVGASFYDILPYGQQKIFSKLIKRQSTVSGVSTRKHAGAFENAAETTGGADLARDNGFSAWFDASPIPYLDFEVGYNRSVHYDLNTVSFAVGVNVGSLTKLAKHF